MSLQEATFLYNDFSELLKEFKELELSENSEGTDIQEEKIQS
jgi:hypothetical protein